MWHSSKFQPSEIIELAIKVEEKGVEFYNVLQIKFQKESSKL